MKRFLTIACVSALVVASVWIGLFFAHKPTAEVTFELLETWRETARNFTPVTWWVRGNILLGLSVVLSGVLIYSLLAGSVFATLFWVVATIRRRFLGSSIRQDLE